MPNPNSVPINVIVNFTGITYDSGTNTWTVPTGKPKWTVPHTTAVPAGDNDIQWNLQAVQGSVPSGFTAGFPTTGGIAFGSDWVGGPPTYVDADTYTATDNFTAPPQDESYDYSVTVTLTSTTDSTITKSFVKDPEVENEGSSLVHAAVVPEVEPT